MVLSDRFKNRAPRGLAARTAIYVLGFGLGSLIVAVVLSFTFVSLAEGLLPGSGSRPSSGKSEETVPRIIGAPAGKTTSKASKRSKGSSKKAPARGNQASDPQDGADDSR